jgi:Mor family transcriptional regulator
MMTNMGIKRMQQEKWYKDLKPSDITTSKDLKLVADYCGIETVIKLLENLSGLSFYVSEKTLVELKSKYIKEKFDGTRDCANRLALDLNVSINHVYKILQRPEESEKGCQLGLFDK